MEPVDFRDIEYVMAVYAEKNFSRAAEKCYTSQPSLSKIIRRFEKNLGTTLFDRSTFPLKITPSGEVIYGYLLELQAVHDKMEKYCDTLRLTNQSDLTIAASTFFSTYVLPPIVSEYQKQHPDFRIKLVECNDNDCRDFLKSGIANIGITANDFFPLGLESEVLKNEQIMLAVPSSHEINRGLEEYALTGTDLAEKSEDFFRKPCISIQAFAAEPFLMLRHGNDMRRRVMNICQDAGVYPNITMELDQLLTAYYLAAAGQGIAFVRSSIPFYTGSTASLNFYKIDHTDTTRPIYLLRSSSALFTPQQTDFVNYLKAYPLPW